MKNLHAALVGLAVVILTALNGWLGTVDLGTITSNPLVLGLLGVAVAALSRVLGTLIGKLPQ